MYNKDIFRQYDIRGIVGKEFDADFVKLLSRAYGTFLKKRNETGCCVGRDARKTGPLFHDLFMEGLSDVGIQVFDLGEVPTPVAYFACTQNLAPNCVVITASHNPKEYNGFKMVLQGKALYGDAIQEIHDTLDRKSTPPVSPKGDIKRIDIISMYLSYLKSHFSFSQPHKFIVDCGNGAAGWVARKVFDLFGLDVTYLFEEVDGEFPNHPADPTKHQNLQEMLNRLSTRDHGYEFGVGYDGDVDRIGVATPNGELLYGDQLLLFLSQEMAHKYEKPNIIADVKTSKVFFSKVKEMGMNPIMFKTGHSLIKAKLSQDPKCPLAGEMSGHIFYKDDFFGYDDSIYVTLRLLKVIETLNVNLQTWYDQLPKPANTPELHVACPDQKKFQVVEKLKKDMQKKYPDATLIDIDGIRLEWKDRWALIRPSNTTPVLVLRFEAETQKACAALQREITDLVKKEVAAS